MSRLQSLLALNIPILGVVAIVLALVLIGYIIYRFIKSLEKSEENTNLYQNKTVSNSNVNRQVNEHILDATGTSSDSVNSIDSADELVAVLTAAIYASMDKEHRPNIRIKSFKRINTSVPIWNLAGRNEYIANKL